MRSSLLAVVALAILSSPARADDSQPGSTTPKGPSWNARCRARLLEVKPELSSFGTVVVTTGPGVGQLTSFGLCRLRLTTRAGVVLSAEIDADETHGLRFGRRGIRSKNYSSWHSPSDDTEPRRPPEPVQSRITLERHYGTRYGNLRGLVDAPLVDAGLGARFAELLKATLDACVADVRTDEYDPTLVWRRRCERELGRARTRLVGVEPGFAVGKVEVQTDSVWLRDPRPDARPSYQAAVGCSAPLSPGSKPLYPPVIERVWSDNGLSGWKRRVGRCWASIYVFHAPEALRTQVRKTLEPVLDRCLTEGAR